MSTRSLPLRTQRHNLEAARSSAAGQFVQLRDGLVHYELTGPAEAQTIVLVHGFSVPYYIWDPTFRALAGAGLRVLRYDLYGRGYSDRPHVAYNADLFDRQLQELLQALQIAEAVDLAGVSMGGAIAAAFTARHPASVRRVALIDPAGLPGSRPGATKLLELPLLGEVLMGLLAERVLVSGLKDDLREPQRFPDYVDRYREQMRYPGFQRALLSTLRSGVLTGAQPSFEAVGRQGRPVLLVWGREDRVLPFEQSGQVRACVPGAEFHAIEDAGHVPHYERPEAVNPILIDFVTRP